MPDARDVIRSDDREQPQCQDAERTERRAIVDAMRVPFRGVPPEEITRETDRLIELQRSERQRIQEKPVATR